MPHEMLPARRIEFVVRSILRWRPGRGGTTSSVAGRHPQGDVCLTIQELGSIGELVGALATIATLVYLATQINQNTKATRLSSLQRTLDGGRDHTIQPLLTTPGLIDIYGRGMASFEQLPGPEQARFAWFVAETVLQMQNVMQLHDEGTLDEVNYRAWLVYTAAILRTPGGEKVWPQVAAIVSPTIADELARFLAENPEQPSLLEVMPVMDARTWSNGSA